MYKYLNNYILRTPIQPLKCLSQDISEILDNKVFMQAIQLASSDLFDAINKAVEKKHFPDKLISSIKKYHTRSCMRCTPFGLFSGFCVGSISDVTSIRLNDASKYISHSRLDMSFLASLLRKLERTPQVKSNLIFYPNNSIYKWGNKLRYTECIEQDNVRRYIISGIESNELVDSILKYIKNGKAYLDIINHVVCECINFQEARQFIDQLIINHIITSEFEPYVNGPDILFWLIETLTKKEENDFSSLLLQIKSIISDIDNATIGTGSKTYDRLFDAVDEFGIIYNRANLLQTDLEVTSLENNISKEIVQQVANAVDLLATLSRHQNKNLDKFKELFIKKYDDDEIPLLQALDPESGIGFSYSYDSINLMIDENPLIQEIPFGRINKSYTQNWYPIVSLLLTKYVKHIQEGTAYIELFDEDFLDWEKDDDTPQTVSVLTKIFPTDKGEVKIFVKNAWGPSATNLLGRFACSSKNVKRIIDQITEIEAPSESQPLKCGIAHLPENRVGNIILKPLIRDYEIPYLTRSLLNIDSQIQLSDLSIFIRNNKIILKSRKLDREIIPLLDCAHNYAGNSIPIYRFLCELQYQNILQDIKLDWGILGKELLFYPRVVYKNIIFSLATWNVAINELKDVIASKGTVECHTKLNEFIKRRKIPKEFLFCENDFEILIDSEDHTSINMFIDLIKDKDRFMLTECIFPKNSMNQIVRDVNDACYANEVIFILHK